MILHMNEVTFITFSILNFFKLLFQIFHFSKLRRNTEQCQCVLPILWCLFKWNACVFKDDIASTKLTHEEKKEMITRLKCNNWPQGGMNNLKYFRFQKYWLHEICQGRTQKFNMLMQFCFTFWVWFLNVVKIENWLWIEKLWEQQFSSREFF